MTRRIAALICLGALATISGPIAHGGAIDIVHSRSFGTEVPRLPGYFNYPSGLAVDSTTGDVFVMDELFGRIQRFDATGNYITEWPVSGGLGVAIDPADHSVYISSKHNHRILKYTPDGQLIRQWGALGSTAGQFDNPHDVAIHPVTRNVFVADTDNRRVQEFTRDGVFVREWAHPDFQIIYGVAIDPAGQHVYVSDAGAVRIHKFDIDGNHLLAWGGIGNAPGQLRWPRHLTVAANGDVIVASTDNNELVRFDANGNYLQTFRGQNDAISSFHPRAVGVNLTTGEIYAPASYSHRIDRFDAAGGYLSSWGQSDTTGSNLNRPKGVAIDPASGDIFVADTWNSKYKRFSSTGVFEMEWGTGLACSVISDETTVNFPSRIGIDTLGNVWTLNGATFYADDLERWSNLYVRQYDLDGNHIFSFGAPGMIAVLGGISMDPVRNEIYVANTRRHKILVFNYSGTLLREFGTFGSMPGQFNNPAGIALDSANNAIFVVDSGNQRIQKLDTNGNHILTFGGPGRGNGQFNFDSQSNIALDAFGHLLVADTNNSRIQVFDLEGRFVQAFGSSGTGNGRFRFPSSVTASGTTLAVADTYGYEIEVYNIIPLPDQDDDNVPDATDNCVAIPNLDQTDSDGDGIGDACEIPDLDNDGIEDSLDNCPATPNADQIDTDNDGLGDLCDTDIDNDGLSNPFELLIGTSPLSADTDGDGVSDHAEVAWDGDAATYMPGADLNPLTADTDGDGFPDATDPTPLAFDPDIVWLDDSVPAGATTVGSWNFAAADPTPFSGALAHVSALAPGTHQHYFSGASATLQIGVGDILFTYVYLDPLNPPSEVMLQWRQGSSWNHRAYWGANNINWGTDGTASRRYMGPLPATGGWVRLEVPASLVGLEGRTLNGMAFTLHGGRASWDYAGKSAMPLLPQLQFSAADYVAAEGEGTATVTVTRSGNTGTAVSVDYASQDGTAGAGDYIPTSGTLSFAEWEISKTISISLLDDAVADGGEILTLTLGNPVNATLGSLGTATLTLADNEFAVSGQITLEGQPLEGVSVTATQGGICTTSGNAYHCTVPPGWSGSVIPSLAGYQFSPAWRSYANVSADAADSYAAALQSDTVWLDDAVPSGASQVGTWSFIGADPAPFSGSLAHQSELAAGVHQHYFSGASSTLGVNVGDILFTYVYLDPANPPSEIMLQWRQGSSWNHRAYWGANAINWGTDGTASRRYMGPLPPAGGWVRLEIPASAVDLEGRVLNGMAFVLYDGRATWDYAGKSAMPPPPQLSFSAAQYLADENGGGIALTVTRTGNTSLPASVDYATTDGTAAAGNDYTAVSGTLSFAAWESSKTIFIPILDDALADSGETFLVTLGNAVDAILVDPTTTTVTIADNEYRISGQITFDGAPFSGASVVATNGGDCVVTGAQYECAVPLGWTGSITPNYAGYRFNPARVDYANLAADAASRDFSAAVQHAETIWLDDAVPTGAATVGSWNFTGAAPAPLLGSLAHQSSLATGIHQHYFYNAGNTLSVNAGDTLFTYVYLDPVNPPSEIMLQWRSGGSWDHRAYWGTNSINWGADGTASRHHMGVLPSTGGWVRLEVPASAVDLEGHVIDGMAFTLFNGKASWDYTGKH